MSEFKKRSPLDRPAVPQERDKKPPKTTVVRAVSMPGKTLTSRLIKPVGAAILLLTAFARADTTTVGAPQGNQGACPFPGCKFTAAGVDVTETPFNVSPGPANMTGPIQQAVDSGSAILIFPPGTYTICNLMPRALTQKWVGAGIGQTFFVGTAGCNNLLATSSGGIFGGPAFALDISGITFQGGVQNQLNINCRDVPAQLRIHDNAFDTGSVGCATGANGINLSGCHDATIENNQFYSSCPGSGGRGMLLAGVHLGAIRRNTSRWQRTFIELGSTVNQPAELTELSDNSYSAPFWALPAKYTNSGATVSYAGSVLTDTAAAFAGLCDQGGASPCAAAAGNWMRAMTAKVTGTLGQFNTTGSMLTDSGQNFTGAGVTRGDLLRTTPLCFGNGAKGQTGRFVCTGAAGTGVWGDSCVCTANADCSSGACEPRLAVIEKIGTATTVQFDEMTRDATCPLGSAICPFPTRRPAGTPLSTAGIAYTIFGWSACQITSYTATTVTCNSDGWITWSGSASTPANATLYEIEGNRPLYNMLLGNTGAPTQVQGLRIANNTATGGFADEFEIFTSNAVITGNYARDSGDTGIVINGTSNTVTANVAEHCGARGIILQGDDSAVTANVAFDSPWVRVSSTTTQGDLVANGNRNTFSGNKVLGKMPTNLNRYGMVAFGTSDSNQFVNNTCGGTYTVGCYRFDGAASTKNRIVGYHGETISNNGGTFAIEGGLSTEALLVANTPLGGSYCGCSDCTVASPTAAGGTGAMAIYSTTGPQWNGR
jgi:hypothetical protein